MTIPFLAARNETNQSIELQKGEPDLRSTEFVKFNGGSAAADRKPLRSTTTGSSRIIASAAPSEIARLYPERLAAWRRRGLSSRAASAVAKAGCDTVAEIASLGREHFGSRPNLGVRSLAELEKLAGWPPKRMSAVDTV